MGLQWSRLVRRPVRDRFRYAYHGHCLWNASVPQVLHAKLGEALPGRVASGRMGQMSEILERGVFVLDQQDHIGRRGIVEDGRDGRERAAYVDGGKRAGIWYLNTRDCQPPDHGGGMLR